MELTMEFPQRERVINPTHDIKLFAGRAHKKLAEEIAAYLGTSVGPMIIKNFADGEIYVQVQQSIRGDDVFLIQPLSNPVNENLMELLIMIDAFKRASAKSITAVIPYYGYARQDRKTSGREAITAKLVADLLHTGQIQGFFNILVDHIYATPVLTEYIKNLNIPADKLVAVSPDTGGVQRTRVFAKQLDCPLAIVDKRRDKHNEAIADHVIGDVQGKICVLVDDMIDTAGTICEASKLLIREGAEKVYVCAAHGILSGPAIQRLEDAPVEEVIITNSIPLDREVSSKFTQLSIAPILGEAISRIHDNESVSSLFGFEKEYKSY